MAVGDIVTSANCKRSIRLLEDQTTTNGAPSTSTQGVPVFHDSKDYTKDSGLCFGAMPAKHATLNVHTSGGSSPTAQLYLWGYQAAASTWYLLTATINVGVASFKTDVAHHSQYTNLGHYDRLYLQVDNIGGTLGTGLQAWMTTDSGVSS